MLDEAYLDQKEFGLSMENMTDWKTRREKENSEMKKQVLMCKLIDADEETLNSTRCS